MASTMRVDIVGSWRQSARPRPQSEQSRKYAWNACSRKRLRHSLFSQSPNIFSSGFYHMSGANCKHHSGRSTVPASAFARLWTKMPRHAPAISGFWQRALDQTTQVDAVGMPDAGLADNRSDDFY
jgi:hypothetical protein